MGSGISATEVSVLAVGEKESPWAIRRCPGYAEGPYRNPPEFQTMQDIALHAFKKFPDNPCLGCRKFDGKTYAPEFTFKTYKECQEIAMNFGSGLYQIGLKEKGYFGVYSENSMEWGTCIDVTALFGFCLISLYDTFGMDSLSHLIEHSRMDTLVASEKSAEKLLTILKKGTFNLKRVIVVVNDSNAEVMKKLEEFGLEVFTFNQVKDLGRQHPVTELPKVDPEDPHYICYSSGTTGQPKGVIISNRSQTSNTLDCFLNLGFREDERHLSYLPLPHVFERIGYSITHFVGGRIGFLSGSVRMITDDMQKLRPTHLSAVPRVITRIYDNVLKSLAASSSFKRAFFWGAYYWKRFWVTREYDCPLTDKLVFDQIKKLTGGCIRSFIVGGASLDPFVHEFIQVALSTPMRFGYGLSEVGAGNICNPLSCKYSRPGTVGGPLPNCEVYLSPLEDYDDPEAGEIIMGGQCLCSGYLYDEEATKDLFVDEERNWIHTGDIGKWDQYGYLSVIDRIRSIFKLAQGEYVAAELLSEIYQAIPLVDQIFVYGDSKRTFLVAIVVPNRAKTSEFVGHDLSDEEFNKICSSNNKELCDEIRKQLDEVANAKKLPGYEKIKGIALESEEWTVANDLQTPTFKLKRKKLAEKYQDVIERLYTEINQQNL